MRGFGGRGKSLKDSVAKRKRKKNPKTRYGRIKGCQIVKGRARTLEFCKRGSSAPGFLSAHSFSSGHLGSEEQRGGGGGGV